VPNNIDDAAVKRISELAVVLWEARNSGVPVPRTAGDILNSIDEAYQVQREIVSLANLRSIGWKVGATSKAVQRVVGTDEPATAMMFEDHCFENGSSIAIFETFNIGIESEFAYRFSHDLPTRNTPYDRDEVLAAVATVIPAMEVVGCRFEGGFKNMGAVFLTADMVANSEWVSGDEHEGWHQMNFGDYPVRLYKDDKQVAEGVGSNALGDPLNVLVWTANHLSRLGDGIKEGEVVSTGTCTGVIPISPGQTFVADFGNLGRVEARFVSKM
jgi:2-keto-4-pentenoate hydratase